MSPACGPSVSVQPKITSSTASGSALGLRSKRALITCAPRSAGWTSARAPLRRPAAVRTASTMYASAIAVSLGALTIRTRSGGDSIHDDGDVLGGDRLDGQGAFWPVPADANPDGVAQ